MGRPGSLAAVPPVPPSGAVDRDLVAPDGRGEHGVDVVPDLRERQAVAGRQFARARRCPVQARQRVRIEGDDDLRALAAAPSPSLAPDPSPADPSVDVIDPWRLR